MRTIDEILTGDALTWATLPRETLAAEHELLRRQLLTAREQIALLVKSRSLADQPEPPGVMTVGKALMLPQVRDGSHWIRYERGGEAFVMRVSQKDGILEWDNDADRFADAWFVGLSVVQLDAPCTLISSQEGAR